MTYTFPKLHSIHTIAFDFDGVFTDNKVFVDKHGVEFVQCDRGDGLGFDILRAYIALNRINISLMVVTKERNTVAKARMNKLKVPCWGGVVNKKNFIDEYFKQNYKGVDDPYERFIYLGNDLNDYQIMKRAGYSYAPIDAHSRIKDIASHVFNQPGGNGFVRVFIESIIGLDLLTNGELDELISYS